MPYTWLDGKFWPRDAPLLHADNRSFKWGDGFFETIRMTEGIMPLFDLHMDRLTASLRLLHYNTSRALSSESLRAAIEGLCKKNECVVSARVRLAVFRDHDDIPHYLIEATVLDGMNYGWQEQGISIGLFPDVHKSMDIFSQLKASSYLPYVLAHRHAEQMGWDDALVLNAAGRICDAARANIFLIRNSGEICTPALGEGCVAGVSRRRVMEQLAKQGRAVHETAITEQDLAAASELFLTNALYGLRSVRSWRDKAYGHEQALALYRTIFSTIFPAACS